MMALQTLIQAKLAMEGIRTLPPRKIINYFKCRFGTREAHVNLKRYGPRIFCCLVTRRCNLDCPWCITPALHDQGFDINPEKLTLMLDHPAIQKCIYVAFSGGEPLILRHFPELVALTRKKGFLVGMTTNGLMLPKRIEEVKKAGVNQINVSIYNTNIDALRRTLPEINKVKRVRTNKIILRSVLEQKPEEIEDAIRLSRDAGCVGTVLFLCLPGEKEYKEIVYDDNTMFKEFKHRITKEYAGYAISWPEPVKRVIRRSDKKCQFPWSVVTADSEGNMGPCCNYYPSPAGLWGNLLKDRTENVFNHPQLKELRAGLMSADSTKPEACQGCYALSDGWYANQ
jgi:MoaA/NifB/PqqE/SkfB family radical SAM enzyme